MFILKTTSKKAYIPGDLKVRKQYKNQLVTN